MILHRSPVVASLALRVAFAAVGCCAAAASGDVVWYEVTRGDLSNDPLHPTALVLHEGVNSVIGAVNGQTDYQDWMAVTVPSGFELSQLILADYDSLDFVAFAGVQVGPAFLGDPFDASAYLGYTHYGVDTFGADLLPLMGVAPGAGGFTPPLGSGVYTFLSQQIGEDSLYQFDFVVTAVPGPGFAGMSVAAAVAWGVRRRARDGRVRREDTIMTARARS